MSSLKHLEPIKTRGAKKRSHDDDEDQDEYNAYNCNESTEARETPTGLPKNQMTAHYTQSLLCLPKSDRNWRKVVRENLDIDYTILYTEKAARRLFETCEKELMYNVGHLAKVRLFGKWIDIPRKQVAHGDLGLSYTFSGNTVPARPWTPLLLQVRDLVSQVSGYTFNFVLINRYQNGNDYMGEHKDDERDLCPDHPIASLSLGQERDFVFKHQDSRGKKAKRHIDPVSIYLEKGSLLMMNSPTNQYWYHSLPKRTKAWGPRINFTFRKMILSKCKPVRSHKEEEKPAEDSSG